MGLKTDIQNLIDRSNKEYEQYRNQISVVMNEYYNKCSEFDVLVGTINAERLAFRKEIRELYKFLQAVGGTLKDEKRITVFDFADEAPAPNQMHKDILPLPEPDFKEMGGAEILKKGLIRMSIDYFENKDMYQDFLVKVEDSIVKYEKDVIDRTIQVGYMKDAIEMAKIYRNIIVIIRDTISEKILPELDLIQAFLYADAIRELVLDGEPLDNVTPCGISEYKGTAQDIHYQFVRNVFDFYEISTSFFKKRVLSDILADRVVTKDEKKQFMDDVDKIEQQIFLVEGKKVI